MIPSAARRRPPRTSAPRAADLRRRTGFFGALTLLLACGGVAPEGVSAQVELRDLVLTLGGSVEGYQGNFSAVTAAVVDSADHATAAVGEVAVRGRLGLIRTGGRDVELSFDGGMRQSAAMGFTVRDYAPREWVGSAAARYQEALGGWGRVVARVGYRGRSVHDRPPMPLFLQPGYATGSGSLGLVTRSFDGVSFDVQVDGESRDYKAPEFVPQLNLLDRRSVAVSSGASWGTASRVRFHGGVRWAEYPHQQSFVDDDPFRRDRTVSVGIDWTYVGDVLAQMGLQGTLNRSNSNRPEYDALSFQALFNAPLPWKTSLSIRAVITGKSYVQDIDFARLVPGEEADNASLAFVQLTRPLADNLDGAVRLGWTRAETDIGRAYYRRFGGALQFNYRPVGF